MQRPPVVRYVGLAGSSLLAVAAYRGGARSPWHPTMTPTTIMRGENGVLLPVAWLIGTLLLLGAWWVGRQSVPSARWAYVTAALWSLPLLAFLPLGSYDIYSYACQGWQQAAGLNPYAGGVDLLGCPWRDAVAPTWHSSPAPYGPVFLVLAAMAARLGGSLAGTVAGLRVVAVLGVLLIGVSLPPLARRRGVPLGRAVWLTLACPLIPIHLVSGSHNDALMVGLLVAGLASATKRRPLLAGLLFGLAVGVKATAIVAVPFAVLIVARQAAGRREPGRSAERGEAVLVPAEGPPAGGDRAPSRVGGGRDGGEPVPVRAEGGWGWTGPRVTDENDQQPRTAQTDLGPILRASGEIGLGLAGALGLMSLLSGRGLGWVDGLVGSSVSVQWTSPSTAVGMVISLVGVNAVPVTRMIGMGALLVVLGWLWWRARRADPLLYAGFALAATVVLAPVFHPWYATWALVVLAATVRRETRWLAAPPAAAAALCLPDGYNLALATKTQGAIAMTIFIAFLAIKRPFGKSGSARGPDRVAPLP